MNTIHAADAEEQEERAKAKHRDEQQMRRDDIGYETRKPRGKLTNGKIRRHTSSRDDDAIAAALKQPFSLALAAIITDAKPLIDLPDFWKLLQNQLPGLRANVDDPALHAEILDGENLSYVYHTAMVQESVRRQLENEVAQVRVAQVARDAAYARGQYGPLGEDFQLHKLRETFEMRVHPVTQAIAFSAPRIARLVAEAPVCDGPVCPVTVFRAVATESLRGIRVNLADLNNNDIVKIAASDEANNKQAATVALRPGMHLHLNG